MLAAVSVPIVTIWTSWATNGNAGISAQAQLTKLERALDGRLGVYALNTANSTQLSYRANEPFFPYAALSRYS